jgi:4-oxalocrotonate tautomerase
MPVITIEGPKVTQEQKAKLIKEIVTKVSEIINVPEESIVTIIKENNSEIIGNGMELLADKQLKR